MEEMEHLMEDSAEDGKMMEDSAEDFHIKSLSGRH